MKCIGILGGTFNPIHIGHLAVAQTACDQLQLDKVLFIPSYYPPHKSKAAVICEKHRMKMVRLAIEDNKKFEACNFEIKKEGKSYSIDTLEHLIKIYPKETKFSLLIGSDMLPGLKDWRRIDDLKKLVQFVVVNRKGYKKSKTPFSVKTLSALDLGLSSSYLRKCLRQGNSVKYLLSDKVYRYIKKNNLYN